MAQTTGRVPIPTGSNLKFGKLGSAQNPYGGGIQQTGYNAFSNVGTMQFGQESMRVGSGGGYGGGGLTSFASRDPVSSLNAMRRSTDAAGRRAWGGSGQPPPSRFRPSLSSRMYGDRVPGTNILSTGFGSRRPKLLSMRRFTSKWLPGGPGQLMYPNPSYMGGAGDFDPEQAGRLGFGRMPGTYAARAGQMGMRATV